MNFFLIYRMAFTKNQKHKNEQEENYRDYDKERISY